MNHVTLEGNLTRDPEVKFSNSGMPIANFTVAVNEGKKSADGSWTNTGHFFDCVCFKDLATSIGKLTKGTKIIVVGKLQQDKWADKQSGQQRSKVSIIVNALAKSPANPQGGQSRDEQPYQQPRQAGPQYQPQVPLDVYENTANPDSFVDDVPF